MSNIDSSARSKTTACNSSFASKYDYSTLVSPKSRHTIATRNPSSSAIADDRDPYMPDNIQSPLKSLQHRTGGAYNYDLGDSLAQLRPGLVEMIMQELWSIFNNNSNSGVTKRMGSTTSLTPSTTSSLSSRRTSTFVSTSGKRLAEDEGDDWSMGDNNGRYPKKPKNPPPGSNAQNPVKFACPFRKHNPHRYGIGSHRLCALSALPNVSRVKLVIVAVYRRLS